MVRKPKVGDHYIWRPQDGEGKEIIVSSPPSASGPQPHWGTGDPNKPAAHPSAADTDKVCCGVKLVDREDQIELPDVKDVTGVSGPIKIIQPDDEFWVPVEDLYPMEGDE